MRRLAIILSVAVLVFGAVSFAGATSVDFEIGTDNSILAEGLTFNYEIDNTLLDTIGFLLSPGESETFNYALVKNVSGPTGIYNITAFLDFDQPADISVDNPVANPGTLTIKNIPKNCKRCTSSKNINIDFSPVDVPFGFGNTGLFTVLLSGFDVNWTGKKCCHNGWTTKTITAKVTLINAPTPAPVPEPSTLLLLGSGILGAMAFLRRRRN